MSNEKRKDISKTIKIDQKLNDQVFEIMKQPGNEEITFSDFVRDALYFYIQILRYHSTNLTSSQHKCQ